MAALSNLELFLLILFFLGLCFVPGGTSNSSEEDE